MNSPKNSPLRPFHLAVPVHDLEAARAFYGGLLGCEEGRSDTQWIDYNLYGHQFVVHLKPGMEADTHFNPVDGHGVPIPHFGVILLREDWDALAQKMRDAGTKFIIEPYVRFEGQVGEQATMFFLDPSGNALEFKSFGDDSQIFAK